MKQVVIKEEYDEGLAMKVHDRWREFTKDTIDYLKKFRRFHAVTCECRICMELKIYIPLMEDWELLNKDQRDIFRGWIL